MNGPESRSCSLARGVCRLLLSLVGICVAANVFNEMGTSEYAIGGQQDRNARAHKMARRLGLLREKLSGQLTDAPHQEHHGAALNVFISLAINWSEGPGRFPSLTAAPPLSAAASQFSRIKWCAENGGPRIDLRPGIGYMT